MSANRHSRRPSPAPLCLALVLSFVAGASAEATYFAQFSSLATAGSGRNESASGVSKAVSETISHSTYDPAITLTSNAKATIRGASDPDPLVVGKVTAGSHQVTSAMTGLERAGLDLTTASANAQLSYAVNLLKTKEFPLAWRLSPFAVPVVLDATASVTSHYGEAGASLQVFYFPLVTGETNLFYSKVLRTTGAVDDAQAETLHVNASFVPFLTGLQVDMGASTASSIDFAPAGVPPLSDAVATVDPTFRFDQAAFDAQAAQMGLATFPLDQYLSFQFSPGLDQLGAPTVPEPSAFLLVALGLPLLIVARLVRRDREPRR